MEDSTELREVHVEEIRTASVLLHKMLELEDMDKSHVTDDVLTVIQEASTSLLMAAFMMIDGNVDEPDED